MRFFYILSVFLHVISAVIWVGGMLFLSLVAIPVLLKYRSSAFYPKLLNALVTRFRLIGWICLLILITTGALNLGFRGYDGSDFVSSAFWQSRFGGILSFKLILVGLVLLLSLSHDFIIGPRAVVLLRENPDSAEMKRMRRVASWLGRLNLLLSLAIIYAAMMLFRG